MAWYFHISSLIQLGVDAMEMPFGHFIMGEFIRAQIRLKEEAALFSFDIHGWRPIVILPRGSFFPY